MADNTRKKFIFTAVSTIVLCVLLLVTLVGSIVYARYQSGITYQQNQVSADDFYFTVDILGDSVDEESSTKTINIYSGTTEVTFYVQNYFDELRVTEQNIKYTVSLTSTLGTSAASLKDIPSGTVSDTLEYDSMATDHKVSEAYTLSVDSNFTSSETVTVTIQSTSPYQKTLTLVFALIGAPTGVDCECSNAATSYFELIIETDIELAIDEAKIVWDTATALQFDSTNSYFALDATYTAVNSKAIPAGGSVSIKFFKTSGVYEVEGVEYDSGSGVYTFTITESV